METKRFLGMAATVFFALAAGEASAAEGVTLLNASYDVTREFYAEFNEQFVKHWKAETGETIAISQSHGGSSKQARAVIDGLEADVVTMNQPTDIDALVQNGGWVRAGWRSRLPNQSAPYSSPIVFLVRKGNPKGIRGWADLIKDGVQPIIPNPKTSGNGRYSYLAAWGYAFGLKRSEADARKFVQALFKHVPVLDTGGRGATTTFAERGIGDVLLTFENEAALISKKISPKDFEMVIPEVTVTAEAPVAVVDKVVDKRGTRKAAEAYLRYLWSDTGQRLAAKHFFRPVSEKAMQTARGQFSAIKLIKVEDFAGDWVVVSKTHFADGGVFDQIYGP